MRHFISFQKKKGIFVTPMKSIIDNSAYIHQINHELMNVGYVMTQELFDALSGMTEDTLQGIYNDLMQGIRKVVGSSGYEPIYKNFPQSVLAMSYQEFAINAIMHYWSGGTWRPEDAEAINREFKIEAVNYKEVNLLSKSDFDSIFTDILYSGTSISKFDKECVEFYLSNGGNVKLSDIKFKETLAFVGKTLLETDIPALPTRNATDVLRIWSVYSGGDEGLKENTRFKNPKSKQSRILKETLNRCNNLEDSFKTYREKWLKMLFYLNPLTTANKNKYSQLYKYAELLRNNPKELETFNAKVERMIKEKDTLIFNLLANRPGVFTRRLDHLVRVFGKTTIDQYVELDRVNFLNLVTAYNHFTDRDKEQAGRGVILASQSESSVVTYDALAPLDAELVAYIKDKLTDKLATYKLDALKDKSIYVDRSLFYTPLQSNNRASSLSLDSKCIGETARYEGNKTLRMYVHWEGRTDIDLSGFIITKDNSVQKIGWNARHAGGNFIVYSGDNTGYFEKNAEYLDINTDKMASNAEWIIVEARIYSGPRNFAGYNGKCHIGWMEVAHPEANQQHWQPKTLQNAMVLNNTAKTAYLMAYHAPSKNIVYLDMAMGRSAVSNNDDALKMRMFLDNFITLDDGGDVSWDKLNQGHLLTLRASNIVEDSKEADIVFDEHTSVDEITRLINA
jgi:hypothetical protein